MKRKIIVVLALVVVIVAAVPFLSGLIMERTVRKAAEDINLIYANTPFGYRFEIINYDRRYLTTDCELKIDLGALKNIYGIESVILKEHARHGYFGVVSTTSLEENAWYNSFINDNLQGQDPLNIKTFYSLFGGIKTTMILDDFTAMIEDEEFKVKEAKMVVATDRNLKNFKASGKWQGVDIGEKISLVEVSMSSDMEMISEFIWDGDVVLDVKSLKAMDTDAALELTDMKVQTLADADKDDNTMSGDVRFSVGSIQAKGNNINDGLVRFAVKGIKMDKYEEFMKLYYQVTSNIMSKMNFNDDSQKDEEIMRMEVAQVGLQMIGAYEKLLNEGLEISISDLQFKLPDGEVKGGITLRLLKDMTFAQFLPIINQPQMLLDIFYLKSELTLPIKLVGENPKMLAPFFQGMQTGLFIKDGGYLVHEMETKDGNIYLNGKEVPLDGLTSQIGRAM